MQAKGFLSTKIFFRWFRLYMCGILAVLFVCAAIILFSLRTIEREINDVQMVSLNHACQSIDSQLKAIQTNVYRSAADNDILSLMQQTVAFQTHRETKIWGIQDQIKSLEFSNVLIDKCLIYVNDGDYLLLSAMKHSPELYFQYVLTEKAMDFEEWIALLKGDGSTSYFKSANGSAGSPLIYSQDVSSLSSGRFLGKILVFLNESQIRRQLNSAKWLPECEIFILDQNNRIITGTTDSLDISSLRTSALGGGEVRELQLDGQTYMTSYAASASSQWRYVSVIPKNVFYQNIALVRTLATSVLVFSIVMAVLIAYYVAKKNYMPVSHIVTTLSQYNEKTEVSYQEFSDVETAIQRICDENKASSSLILEQRRLLKRLFLARLLVEDFTGHSLPVDVQLANNGIRFRHPVFTVILMQLEEQNGPPGRDANDCAVVAENTLYGIFSRSLADYDVWCTSTYRHMAAILNHPGRESADQDILAAVQTVYRTLANDYNMTLSMAVSGSISGIPGIRYCYDQAVITMEHLPSPQGLYLQSFNNINLANRHLGGTDTTLSFVKDMHYYASNRNFQQVKKRLQAYWAEHAEKAAGASRLRNSKNHIIVQMLIEIEALAAESVGDGLYRAVQAQTRLYPCVGGDKLLDEALQVIDEIQAYVEERTAGHETKALTERAVRIIRENINNPNLNVSMVADILGVDIVYLSRHFKRNTGLNSLDYINRLRVESAKEMLGRAASSVEEIAIKVGFSNSMSFIRVFKKYEGMTPGQYKS